MTPEHQFPTSADGAKSYTFGTHRAVSPEETLERIAPSLGKFGITRVADVTGLDRIGIPVSLACRPNARSLSVSQGKGLTLAAARASAVMESVELHHAERVELPLLLASVNELQASGRPMVDVSMLPSATSSRYHANRPLLWVEAREYTSGQSCWIPFEVVHASALLPPPTGSGCFSSTTNGLASGNHKLEALAHGLCEVIERDAAAVWQVQTATRRAATRVDLHRVHDGACREVLERYRAAEIEVRAWETTSDIRVPAYLCEIIDPSSPIGTTGFTGMGCHLSPPIALLRALTEAAQSRMTYITGSRDDLFRRDYRAVRIEGSPSHEANTVADRTLEDAPADSATSSFEGDVRTLVDRLAAAGLPSVLVVDLTSDRHGIPVMRVVVPGLEGPDDEPSYVPGRRVLAVTRECEPL